MTRSHACKKVFKVQQEKVCKFNQIDCKIFAASLLHVEVAGKEKADDGEDAISREEGIKVHRPQHHRLTRMSMIENLAMITRMSMIEEDADKDIHADTSQRTGAGLGM